MKHYLIFKSYHFVTLFQNFSENLKNLMYKK